MELEKRIEFPAGAESVEPTTETEPVIPAETEQVAPTEFPTLPQELEIPLGEPGEVDETPESSSTPGADGIGIAREVVTEPEDHSVALLENNRADNTKEAHDLAEAAFRMSQTPENQDKLTELNKIL